MAYVVCCILEPNNIQMRILCCSHDLCHSLPVSKLWHLSGSWEVIVFNSTLWATVRVYFSLTYGGRGDSLMLCSAYSSLWIAPALIWLWERYITVLQLDHRLRLHSISVCCQSAKTKMCPSAEAHIALFNLGLSHLHREHTVTAG